MTLKIRCSYPVGKSRKCRYGFYSILFTLCFLFVLATAGHQCYGFPIASDPGIFQVSLSASFDGTNYLVGFQENNGQTRQVSAQFVSQSGTLAGPKITLGLQGGPPRVAFDGTNYFLITEEDSSTPTYIYGQFVSKAGEIMSSPFNITSGGTAIARPAMIFDGTNYFVVWNDSQTLYGQFVSPAGGLVGSPITICSKTASSPDVPEVYNAVSGDANILVAWADSRSAVEQPFALDIYGQLVGKSGASTPGPLVGVNFPINVNDDWSDMWTVGLAYDGTNHNYLVAWNDMPPNSGDARLYTQLISESGTAVGGTMSIGILTQNHYRPAPMLAFDGTNYLLTWINDKNDKDHDGSCDLYEGTCWDSYGQFISPLGQVLGSPFLVFGGGKNQFSYPIFGGGQYLLVTNSFDQFEGTSGTVTGAFISPQHAIQTGSPRISVIPTYVNFGKVKAGGTLEMTVTIKNTGTSDLAINLIDIAGLNAPEFSQTNDCTSVLIPGGFCTATVTFAPVSFGNKTATMSISSSAPTTPTVNVKLLGAAPPPLISASTTSVNFGNVALGHNLQKTITIKNTGTSDLEISDISITGTNASEFDQTNDCTTIPAGASCTITSTFAPAFLPYGQKIGLITISSNDPKKPNLFVKLLGNAPPPKISLSPISVSFGSVQAGSTSSLKTVIIKNTGTSDLQISDISIAGTNASEFSQTNDCTSILSTNGFCTVTVTFQPMLTGTRSAVLTVSSNDPLKPTGNGVLSGSGIIMTSGTGIWDAAKWDSSTWD